jgi:hypothetical protein
MRADRLGETNKGIFATFLFQRPQNETPLHPLSRPKNHAAKSLFIGYQESLQKLHLKKV